MFSERLARELALSQMTLTELARQTQISRSTLYTYLSGRSEPTLTTAAEIAKAFGVSLDYLAGLRDETPAEEASRMYKIFTDRYGYTAEGPGFTIGKSGNNEHPEDN